MNLRMKCLVSERIPFLFYENVDKVLSVVAETFYTCPLEAEAEVGGSW